MVIILMTRVTVSYDPKYGYCCSAKVILLVSFNGNYKEITFLRIKKARAAKTTRPSHRFSFGESVFQPDLHALTGVYW